MEAGLKFVDLFAGIGGFHVALRAVDPDAECVFACDIDERCRLVYQANFGQVIGADIQAITTDDTLIRSTIPAHDILCAGFPCQPFSKSGAQRGIEEARGTLFYDICRVLKVRRPQFILLENVPNIVGPRHRSTWATIIGLLREIGYAVSDQPTMLSPHQLPPSAGGTPQIRNRVFIPGVYVGRADAREFADLPELVEAKPFPEWTPSSWRVMDYLEKDIPTNGNTISEEKAKAINVWNEFVKSIDGSLPGFPIWADVMTGRLREDPELPGWKNDLIRRNADFNTRHRRTIAGWLERHQQLDDLDASFRKLEWQAKDGSRDIWSHAVQFRPSGIRVRPLTYLPALVAINQTSVIGPLRRLITPREAARLQGFSDSFVLHPEKGIAFRQLGNAVAVGPAQLVANELMQAAAPGRRIDAWADAARRGAALRSVETPGADISSAPSGVGVGTY